MEAVYIILEYIHDVFIIFHRNPTQSGGFILWQPNPFLHKLYAIRRNNYWNKQNRYATLISPHSESTVLIAVKKAEVRTLETLSVKTPDDASRKSIASLLNKTLKKLALAEKVLEFRVKAEGNAIDPRVEKLIAKLASRIENPPKVEEAAFEKLFQCRFKFDHYNKPPKNLATEHALEKARWMIGKLDMQLLQNCHELIEFKESAMSEKYRGFYQNLANPLEAQNLSSAIYAIQYVALCIAHADLRIKTFGLGKTDMWFHGFMANYLKDKSTQFSLEDLIQTLYTDKFVAIPPSNPLFLTQLMPMKKR